MIQIQMEKSPPVADSPLEHLTACHRRIEQRLDIFERAGAALEQTPEAALVAITNSIRFMDLSGALHTADEEESVFPRMRASLSQSEIEYLDQLESEHLEADKLYHRLKDAAAALHCAVTAESVAAYRAVASQLGALYRRHIASEDASLAELGKRTLTSADLESIQFEMRARRT